MLLVSGLLMSNVWNVLLLCCHSSQNTVTEHELSDNPSRHVEMQHNLLHCFLDEFVADVILSPQAASLFRDNEIHCCLQ